MLRTLESQSTVLAILKRGEISEVVIRGMASFKDGGKVYSESQDSHLDTPIWARSLLKPWQFMATLSQDMTIHPFFAMALSSHQGELEHRRALIELALHLELDETRLCCPAVLP